MTRVVLDASVLLSAAVGRPESPPSVLLDAVRSGEIDMVACERLLAEVRDGLATRYFRGRLTEEERAAFPPMLGALAVLLEDPTCPPPILRDPDDDYLVALARVANATAIITGDRDLLDHDGLEPPAHNARQGCVVLGLIDP